MDLISDYLIISIIIIPINLIQNMSLLTVCKIRHLFIYFFVIFELQYTFSIKIIAVCFVFFNLFHPKNC